MINSPKVLPVFPKYIAKYDKLEYKFSEEQKQFIETIIKSDNEETYYSKKIKSQTKFCDHSLLVSFKKEIEKCINDYFVHVYRPKNKVELKMTLSWVEVRENEQDHHLHSHPNSFVSAVYYYDCPKEGATISFFDNRYDRILIEGDDQETLVPSEITLDVKKGELLVFDSSLFHLVRKKQLTSRRVSFGFNSMPYGIWATDYNLHGFSL